MKLGDLFPDELAKQNTDSRKNKSDDKKKRAAKSRHNAPKPDTFPPVTNANRDGVIVKKHFLKDVKPGDIFTEPFHITDATLRQAKNGSYYISAGLSDFSGTIPARMWDVKEHTFEAIRDTEYVEVHGRVELYSSRPQLIINSIRPLDPDSINPADFLPVSSRDPNEMEAEFRAMIAAIKKPAWRAALNAVFDDEVFKRFRISPAAKEYHHAWIHGLMEHSLSAARTAASVANMQPNIDADILIAGTMIHDIGKMDEISANAGFEYTSDGRLLGHIALGAMQVDRKCRQAGIDDGIRTLMLHMILSHHGTHEFGSPVIPRTKEALALHHIECMDAKIQGAQMLIDNARRKDGQPVWTGFSRMFDGPLYEPAGNWPDEAPTEDDARDGSSDNDNPTGNSQDA